MLLFGYLDGNKAYLLIDTGVTCSIRRCKDQTMNRGKTRRGDSLGHVYADNGTKLLMSGEVYTEISLANRSVIYPPLTSPDIPWDSILGNDFLFKFRCCVDYENKVFRFLGSSITLKQIDKADFAVAIWSSTRPLSSNLSLFDYQINKISSGRNRQPTTTNHLTNQLFGTLPPVSPNLSRDDLKLLQSALTHHTTAFAQNDDDICHTDLV